MKEKGYNQNIIQDGEKENPVKSGLGLFLRNERIKAGLDYKHIFNITRLQPHILNALEDEDWDNLPSPVLVKGFIRTYAKTIGLDETKALNLYEDYFKSQHSEPPKSLKQVKNKMWLPAAVTISFLTVICVYYVWAGYPFHQVPFSDIVINKELIDDPGNIHKPDEKLSTKNNKIKLSTNQIDQIPDVFEIDSHILPLENQDMAEVFPEEKILAADVTGASEVSAPELTLRANITEETWLNIIIDDKDPMEYIFQPGSSHEWKADRGFRLHIGNAGGINFNINGSRIKNLGKTGQVIRIALPQNYKIRSPQN